MDLDIQGDFVVDTQEHCFVCLSEVPAIKVEPGLEGHSLYNYSLQCLSRYLRIDIGKVINGKDHFSTPHLLGKVDRSKLKVRLCEGCVGLTERFSKLYQQLEKIEMEVYSCASLINEKLMMAEKTGKADRFGNWTDGESLRIAKILRKEAILKCSKRTALPRIKLQNLNIDLISEGRLAVGPPTLQTSLHNQDKLSGSPVNANLFQPNFEDLPHPDIEIGNVKVEVSPPGSIFNEEPLGNVEDGIEGTVDKLSPATTSLPKSTRGRTYRKPYKLDPRTAQYKCKLCPKEFPSYHQFYRHRDRIHSKAKYKCDVCGKEFNHRESRERHHQTFHIGVRFRCSTCNKIFTLQHNLHQHQRTKNCGIGQVSKHKCANCGKEFTRSNGLMRHLKSVHFQLKEHECNQCGKKFQRHYQLNEHQRKVHMEHKVKTEVKDLMSLSD